MNASQFENRSNSMSDTTELRMLRLLENINSRVETVNDGVKAVSDRVTSIETQMLTVIRLEEKVNAHENTLTRHTNVLDSHTSKIHKSELAQAGQVNYSDLAQDMKDVKSEINTVKKYVEDKNEEIRCKLGELEEVVGSIENTRSREAGQKDIVKQMLGWVSAILSGVIVVMVTSGS